MSDREPLLLSEVADRWRPPLVLPVGWHIEQNAWTSEWSNCYKNSARKLVVMVSAARERDGHRWVHYSMSHKHRVPTWEEFTDGKDLFLGRDVEAYQVFPPRVRWVNFCENALHLWHCLEGDVLPDFRQEGII